MRKYLLTALLLTGLASAVGTPAGTQISNIGTLELSDTAGGGSSTTIQSAAVVVNVQQVYNLTISPDGTTAAPGQTVPLAPGATGTLTYTLTNTGNGADSFNLAAVAANVVASGASIAGIYLDSKTSGVVGSYDAGDTLVTSTGTLAADASATLFVRYTMPTGASGGGPHQLNLTGTSAGDTTRTDTNNVGQFTTTRVIDLGLASNQTKTVAAGGTVTFTDMLTNTGNTTLSAAEITATVSAAATNKATQPTTNNFTVSYQVSGPSGTFTGSDLEAVLDSALQAGLPAGGSATITVTVTANANVADGDTLTLALETYSPVSTTTSTTNNAPQGDTQGRITNVATAQRGLGSVTKTVARCTSGTTCPTIQAAGTAAISAKPGEYVVYYLQATNTGSGSLYSVRLSDALPANFVPTRIGALTNEVGTLKFSTNGTSWTSDVATLGTITGGASTVYVAVENGGSATSIDNSDTFTGGGYLRLRIVGYIRDGATTGSVVVRDDAGLTIP